MRTFIGTLSLGLIGMMVSGSSAQATTNQAAKPTIVLVHGAFTEPSTWNGVIAERNKVGIRVIAAADRLRSVASDAAAASIIVSPTYSSACVEYIAEYMGCLDYGDPNGRTRAAPAARGMPPR